MLKRAFHPRAPFGLVLHALIVCAGIANLLSLLGIITLGSNPDAASGAYQSGARFGAAFWVLVGLFAARKLQQAFSTAGEPQAPPAPAAYGQQPALAPQPSPLQQPYAAYPSHQTYAPQPAHPPHQAYAPPAAYPPHQAYAPPAAYPAQQPYAPPAAYPPQQPAYPQPPYPQPPAPPSAPQP